MDLSRRGFFKGVAALFAGAVAAQLASCTTGPAPLAVAQEPIVEVVKERRVARWLHPGHINKYKHEILAHAVPQEVLTIRTPILADLKKISKELRKNSVKPTEFPTILTATEVEENHRIERVYIAKRFLPYSPDPLIEGITPTPDALLERGQPVG